MWLLCAVRRNHWNRAAPEQSDVGVPGMPLALGLALAGDFRLFAD